MRKSDSPILERAVPAMSAGGVCLCFGVNENGRLGEGWHERELWAGDRVYRYTEPRATLPIDPSWLGRTLAILLSAPASAVGGRVAVSLKLGDRRLGAWDLRDDRWRLLEASLPTDADGAERSVIEVSPSFTPDRALGNGDHRLLGVRVASIHIRARGAGEEPVGVPAGTGIAAL